MIALYYHIRNQPRKWETLRIFCSDIFFWQTITQKGDSNPASPEYNNYAMLLNDKARGPFYHQI